MFNREAQAARTGWAEHEPVCAGRERLILQGLREIFVVDAEVFDLEARLGDASGTAGFKDVHRATHQASWKPAAHRSAAEPVIFKVAKLREVGVAGDGLARVPVPLPGE